MAVPFVELIAAGVDLCFYGTVDSAGYLIGSSLTAPTNGNTAGSVMKRLKGVQTISNDLPEADAVDVPGDNTSMGTFLFAAAETARFTMDKAVFNMALDALMQGTKTKQLGSSSITVGVIQPETLDSADMCFIIQSPAKKFDVSQGAKAWTGYIIPLAQGTPQGRQSFETRAAANDRTLIVTNRATQMPNGMAITDTDFGTLSLTAFPFDSDYPLCMQRFNGDGTAASFILAYTPGSADDVVVTVNGVLQVITTAYTLNLTTKTITFTAGNIPVVGAKIEVLWGFVP